MLSRSGLIAKLHKRRSAILSIEDANIAVNLMFQAIIAATRAGRRIEIRKFGVWRPRKYKTRFGINQSTKKRCLFVERKTVFFSPSKHLIERMNLSHENNHL